MVLFKTQLILPKLKWVVELVKQVCLFNYFRILCLVPGVIARCKCIGDVVLLGILKSIPDVSLHLQAFEMFHVDDNVLLCFKNVVELNNVLNSNKTLQYFGFPSDNFYLFLAQRLLINNFESCGVLIANAVQVAFELVLDYHHNTVAAHSQQTSKFEKMRKLDLLGLLKKVGIRISNVAKVINQSLLTLCHINVFSLFSQYFSRTFAEIVVLLVGDVHLIVELIFHSSDPQSCPNGPTFVGVNLTVMYVAKKQILIMVNAVQQ